MEYAAFAKYFPEIAEKETRGLTVHKEAADGLPVGKYLFIEMFCTDPDCDCRNARIIVVKCDEDGDSQQISHIRFCWAEETYYKSIYMDFKPFCGSLPGSFLDPMGLRSSHDAYFLSLFNTLTYSDSLFWSKKQETAYCERVQRHYAMFKEHMRELSLKKQIIKEPKISRNSLCACGSQLKYKKCCGKS